MFIIKHYNRRRAPSCVSKPRDQIKVTLTGTQPELEQLFAERYERAVRMNRARAERKAAKAA